MPKTKLLTLMYYIYQKKQSSYCARMNFNEYIILNINLRTPSEKGKKHCDD